MVFMGALLVQWRFGPPVPKTIAEANNPDTAARTDKTWKERERETQRQREREREGEGIRKGVFTLIVPQFEDFVLRWDCIFSDSSLNHW